MKPHAVQHDVRRKNMLNSMMPVYAAIVAAAIAIASAVFTVVSQQRMSVLKERQQTYAAIMGARHLRNQLVVSRFEALIFSDYHERRWQLAGSPNDSFDFREAQRWMHRSEELVLEIARANQALFKELGVARTAFSPSPELNELIERLYRFSTPAISFPTGQKGQDLEEWKKQAVTQLQALVEKEYGAPTDALLQYLNANMRTGL